MSVTTWVCAFCSKHGDTSAMLPSGIVYDAEIPKGWAWAKYQSARMPPGSDTRALGCCVEHAKLVAERYTVPFDVPNITITKVQE